MAKTMAGWKSTRSPDDAARTPDHAQRLRNRAGVRLFHRNSGGDEFVGLTRVSQRGGQNVLASLWAVNDQSTRELMVRFYRDLLATRGAEALARAQRELRQRDIRYRHPYYWAGFVISGSIN